MLVNCENCGEEIKKRPSKIKTLKNIYCSKKCKIEIRHGCKKNSRFFEKIDTEEKAYWLGFICADGWMAKSEPSFGIGLGVRDKNHLSKIADLFDVKISEDEKRVQIQVYNPITYEHLLDKDVVPLKSYIDCFKVFDYIPEYLMNHFIRGWFDGDGSISLMKKNASEFSIVGTLGNIEKIQNLILENVEILNKTKILPCKNIFALKWGGSSQLMDLREWLYKDATVFLERKKDKFDKVHIKNIKGTSKYRGVHKQKTDDKWVAQISVSGKIHRLGAFFEENEAALAYNKSLIKFNKSLNYKNIIKE